MVVASGFPKSSIFYGNCVCQIEAEAVHGRRAEEHCGDAEAERHAAGCGLTMSCAALMPVKNKERKRQYSALRRAVYREAPPALVAKFSLANDGERFFGVRSSF